MCVCVCVLQIFEFYKILIFIVTKYIIEFGNFLTKNVFFPNLEYYEETEYWLMNSIEFFQ